jgi:putative DNA primase/helicase
MPTKTEEQEREAKAFRQFVVRVRSARSHDAVLKIASRDSRFVALAGDLDQQPVLLPCLNGTVDLRTGELCPAEREDLLSRVVRLDYDPTAKAPRFEKFLKEIQPDPRMQEFLQRLWGYGLFGTVYEHIFPILYGDGANGKGVLAQAVQRIIGEYAQTVPRSVVVDLGKDQHKTQIARLHRTRIGIVHETQRGARLNVEAVKMLTGGDTLTGNFMRQDFFDFEPTHTLYLLSNFKPQVDNALKAIWRRLLLVPFKVEIHEDDQDLSLPDKIVAEESAGVLRWLVEGAAWWWTFSQMRDGGSGLLPPKCVVDETREYQRDEDVIGRFVEECCELGAHAKVRAGDVYRAYKEYCKREGIDDPASSNMFAEALKRISYADGKRVAKKRDGAGRYYEGIGLPASDDGDPRVPDDDPESWV